MINQLAWTLDNPSDKDACLAATVDRWYNSLYSELLDNDEPYQCVDPNTLDLNQEEFTTIVCRRDLVSLLDAFATCLIAALEGEPRREITRLAQDFSNDLFEEVRNRTIGFPQ